MLKGWKTVAFNVASALVFFLGWDGLTAYLSPKTIAEIVVVANLVLRWLTTTALGKSS